MIAMASQLTSRMVVYLNVYPGQAQIKDNMKAPRHWPVWREFTGDQWLGMPSFDDVIMIHLTPHVWPYTTYARRISYSTVYKQLRRYIR